MITKVVVKSPKPNDPDVLLGFMPDVEWQALAEYFYLGGNVIEGIYRRGHGFADVLRDGSWFGLHFERGAKYPACDQMVHPGDLIEDIRDHRRGFVANVNLSESGRINTVNVLFPIYGLDQPPRLERVYVYLLKFLGRAV